MTGHGSTGRPGSHRSGPGPRPGPGPGPRPGPGPGLEPRAAVLLSVLSSAVTVAAAGCFCALVYPIIKGFWSILVLSLLAGLICCVFSWTFSFLDSYRPGLVFPTPLTLQHYRDGSGRGVLLSYGVAVVNGVMATLTVIWSLS